MLFYVVSPFLGSLTMIEFTKGQDHMIVFLDADQFVKNEQKHFVFPS